jgi:hypothetical protein
MIKKIFLLLMAMLLISYPLMSMPVPSEDPAEDPSEQMEIQGSGHTGAVTFLVVFGVITLAGLYMLADDDEGNDMWGFALAFPALVTFELIFVIDVD